VDLLDGQRDEANISHDGALEGGLNLKTAWSSPNQGK